MIGRRTNWFAIIKNNKKNTKQSKLPKELVDAATVAVDSDGNPINADKFFVRKPNSSKPTTASKLKPNSKQTKIIEG
tara:strand:- start:180 stop:410 length:231 start_codon:yes stop_codon:yes gene_type:complete